MLMKDRARLFSVSMPSWSCLYRKMTFILAKAGYRAVAPDLIGFGKSDKPMIRIDYSYAKYTARMKSFIDALELRDMIIIGQYGGSTIGFRLVVGNMHRLPRVVPLRSERFYDDWLIGAINKIADAKPRKSDVCYVASLITVFGFLSCDLMKGFVL